MKKNSGKCYLFYKEWKTQSDAVAPIALGIIGMVIGYYARHVLTSVGAGDLIPAGTMALLTALPVGLYNKVTSGYAAKIQEDADFDKYKEKEREINNHKKSIRSKDKEIEKLKADKIRAYESHKKTAQQIQRILNKGGTLSTLRDNICNLIYAGDGEIFKHTVEINSIEVNEGVDYPDKTNVYSSSSSSNIEDDEINWMHLDYKY